MNAVILAGGFGSRLQPLTDTVPKPLLPVANVPMMDYSLAHLSAFGIRNVVLTLGYKAEQIIEWTTGYRSLVSHFLIEDVPLGTAGGVKAAQNFLDDRFIVLSGDALENVDFDAMLRNHVQSGKLATMAVTRVADPRQFGVVEYDESGVVIALTEKPPSFTGDSAMVNCGVYILERAALRNVPNGIPFDFSRDLFPQFIKDGQLGVYEHDGYWSDLGTPNAYFDANFRVLRGGFFAPLFNRYRDISHFFGQENPSLVSYSATVTGHIEGCIVAQNAFVASGASLHECIVLPDAIAEGRHSCEIIGGDFALSVQSLPPPIKTRNFAGIRTNT
ncbi:MAG: nucleotidyltransferase family protein [Clostridiales bacterium]|nr:nucleotidyltransferase family protein [Clostridiales bacterium]